jgi:hypothetical protein
MSTQPIERDLTPELRRQVVRLLRWIPEDVLADLCRRWADRMKAASDRRGGWFVGFTSRGSRGEHVEVRVDDRVG